MATKATEREMNKALGLMLAAAPLAPRIFGLLDFLCFPSSNMEAAILKNLNLTPDQVKVEVKTGSHVMVDKTMQDIMNFGANIVTGEHNSVDFKNFLDADPTELAKEPDLRDGCNNPGVGTDPIEIAGHSKNLQLLVANNVDVIALDADMAVLFEDLEHPPSEIYKQKAIKYGTVAAGTLVTAGIALTMLDKKGKKNKKDNNTIKKLGFMAGLLIEGGFLLRLLSQSKKFQEACAKMTGGSSALIEEIGRNLSVESNERREIEFEKILKIFDDIPVMGYVEGLVDVRNLQMSYNLWRLIALSTEKNKTQNKIFSHHGSAHGEIEDLVLLGPAELQKRLSYYTSKVSEYGEQRGEDLTNKADIEHRSNGMLNNDTFNELYDAVSELTRYIVFFQDEVQVGSGTPLMLRDTEVLQANIPPSAKTLIFRELINALDRIGPENNIYTKSGYLKTAMMAALTYTANLESEVHVINNKILGKNEPDIAVGALNFDNEKVVWFDQAMKVNIKTDLFKIDGKIIVGCMEINGKICPIVREVNLENDKIIATEKLILGPGIIIEGLNKRIYEKIPPANQPPFSVGLEYSLAFEQLSTPDLTFSYSGEYPVEAYWSQGKDPANINILTIKK